MGRVMWWVGVSLGLCCWAAEPTRAAAPERRHLEQALRRQEDVLRDAKQRLETARARVANRRNEATKAQGEVGRLTTALQTTRRQVEEAQEAAGPLVAARETLQGCQAALEAALIPLRETLGQEAGYRQAIARRDAARQELTAPGAPVDRETLAKKVLEAAAAVRKLEQDAVAADPAASATQRDLAAAETRVRELCRERDAAIVNDPRVAQVNRDLDAARTTAATAEQQVLEAERHREAAERELRREEDEKHRLAERLRDDASQRDDRQRRQEREERELRERLQREKLHEEELKKAHEREEHALREQLARERKEHAGRERQEKDREKKKGKPQEKKKPQHHAEKKPDKPKPDKKASDKKDDHKDKKDDQRDKKK